MIFLILTLFRELTADEKFELVRSVGEECIKDEELKNVLAKKPNPTCYDGFEPSGRMHIAQVQYFYLNLFLFTQNHYWQGILKAVNVNKCTKAGCTFIFWVAGNK